MDKKQRISTILNAAKECNKETLVTWLDDFGIYHTKNVNLEDWYINNGYLHYTKDNCVHTAHITKISIKL